MTRNVFGMKKIKQMSSISVHIWLLDDWNKIVKTIGYNVGFYEVLHSKAGRTLKGY